MLVRAFEIDVGRPFQVGPVLQREGMGRAGIEPDVEDVLDHRPWFVGSWLPRKRSLAPSANQASAPSFSKASMMRWLTASSFSTLPSSSAKTQIGTPQARWRDSTQSGRSSIMARRRVCPAGRHEARVVDRVRARGERSVVPSLRGPVVHMDEPLRRVAEDDRLLRAPRMRILVLQPSAREQHVALDQRVDDRLVGVALLAVVVDDARRPALAVRPEARRILGEEAGIVDGEGDRRCRCRAARSSGAGIHPGVKVLAAMTGRGVHEARAGIVGDMVAGEHRDGELVAAAQDLSSGWSARHQVLRRS